MSCHQRCLPSPNLYTNRNELRKTLDFQSVDYWLMFLFSINRCLTTWTIWLFKSTAVHDKSLIKDVATFWTSEEYFDAHRPISIFLVHRACYLTFAWKLLLCLCLPSQWANKTFAQFKSWLFRVMKDKRPAGPTLYFCSNPMAKVVIVHQREHNNEQGRP